MNSDDRREPHPDDCPAPGLPELPTSRSDSFAPPPQPCECHCLHCGCHFSSTEIWFQKVLNDPQGFAGFWMCPTPNCSGAGFAFDLFPTDEAHPANAGWHDDDEDDDDTDDENAGDDSFGDLDAAMTCDDLDFLTDEPEEYDPSEPKYVDFDALLGLEEDDLEGEEWKLGLQPGEHVAKPASKQSSMPWDDHAVPEKKYDEPDQRPRELDWSNREDRSKSDLPFKDDDIPF